MTELTARLRLLVLLAAPLALVIGGSARADDAATTEESATVVLEISDAVELSRARPRLAILVEREGVSQGFFTEVSGLGSETAVVEYREGSDENAPSRKLPGRLSFGNVTLKRKLIPDDRLLWEWRQEVVADFPSARSDVTITLLTREGEAVAVWSLENAWPAKLTGPDLDSDDNEIALETLVIAHERIERIR